jgi:RNA polymerase sigma-70 factor (ECF subfamily)
MRHAMSAGRSVAAIVDVDDALSREEAFQRLAERHLADAYGLARAILHDAAEAEDATHDAFVVAWRKWDTLRDVARFQHWFDRILVNTCRNRLRRSARADRAIWSVLPQGPVMPRYAADHDTIASALAALGPEHRIVVALRFYRDLTIPEIARRTGLRQGTVKSRLHYALRRLHVALDDAEAREVLG